MTSGSASPSGCRAPLDKYYLAPAAVCITHDSAPTLPSERGTTSNDSRLGSRLCVAESMNVYPPSMSVWSDPDEIRGMVSGSRKLHNDETDSSAFRVVR
jgi:hypothetical protein